MSKQDLQIVLFNSRRGFTLLNNKGLIVQAMAVQNQAHNMVTHAKGLEVITTNECKTMKGDVSGW